jgi:hypothetical protein
MYGPRPTVALTDKNKPLLAYLRAEEEITFIFKDQGQQVLWETVFFV